MILREPCLPPGWYPRDGEKVGDFLGPNPKNGKGLAAVAPHAGWYYSGFCASRAVSSLDSQAETVVVLGGHLSGTMPILAAPEDAVRTPLGIMKIDAELRESFQKMTETSPDRYQDNTVEVLLPMVHYFFPDAALLWLRFPAALSSFDAGKLLSECSASVGRRITVLASTDLTHYGDNYGFSPRGKGRSALDWVKDVNDPGFINAVLEGDHSKALSHAEENSSACSAGAVIGVMGFAAAKGLTRRQCLGYHTSADVDEGEEEIPDNFVGYAAISFEE